MFIFLSLISEIIIYHSGNFIYKLDTEESTATLVGHLEEKLEVLNIPSSVKSPKGDFTVSQIGPNVFKNDHSISGKVYIPATIKNISEYAFYNCSITEIEFAPLCQLETIGYYAFAHCVNIKEDIVFPNALKKIGRAAFMNCIKLPGIMLNVGLQIIYIEAFQNCYELGGTLNIPTTLVELEMFAFKNCYKLTYVDFGSNPNLAKYKPAFDGCVNIEKFNIHQSKVYATDTIGAFYKVVNGAYVLMNVPKTISVLTIKFDLKFIDDNAFQYATSLNSIVFAVKQSYFELDSLGALLRKDTPTKTLYFVPRNATAFNADKELADVKPHAFRGCYQLSTFTVSEGNLDFSVEAGALLLNNRLVAVPRTATEYTYKTADSHISNPFDGCNNLKTFKVDPSNPYIHVQEGTNVLYNFGDRSLLRVPPAFSGDLTILDSVVNIDESAFQNCKNIRSLHVGKNIKSVNEIEFIDTENLIVYVQSLPSIFSDLPFIKVQTEKLSSHLFVTLKNNNILWLILGGVAALAALNIIIVIIIVHRKRGNIEIVNPSPLLTNE